MFSAPESIKFYKSVASFPHVSQDRMLSAPESIKFYKSVASFPHVSQDRMFSAPESIKFYKSVASFLHVSQDRMFSSDEYQWQNNSAQLITRRPIDASSSITVPYSIITADYFAVLLAKKNREFETLCPTPNRQGGSTRIPHSNQMPQSCLTPDIMSNTKSSRRFDQDTPRQRNAAVMSNTILRLCLTPNRQGGSTRIPHSNQMPQSCLTPDIMSNTKSSRRFDQDTPQQPNAAVMSNTRHYV
ncbi:hypothetical protein ACJJTC_018369 [Scirpophaga incertulas]